MPFGRQTWSWFATIAKPFFKSEMRWRAIGMFALLITWAFAGIWPIRLRDLPSFSAFGPSHAAEPYSRSRG